MSNTPDIDIRPDHWEIVRAILQEHVPQYEVWAFGSRAKWTAKEFSDLDLAIMTDEPLPKEVSAALADAFDESDLPYKIDVVDWAETNENFQKTIRENSIVLRDFDSLIDIATFASGGTPSKANPDYWSGDIPWLTPKDMSNFNGHTTDTVSESAICNGTRLAPADSIFIAVRGMSLHNEIRVAKSSKPIAFNQDIKAIIPKNIDSDFLYYAIVSQSNQLLGFVESAGHGTGRLPSDRLASLLIPRFTSDEEKTIGRFFRAIDDKIELNRRMNETLESMARAIFKDWFVDFGPVRAKAEGRQPEGLSEDAAMIFPSSFNCTGIPSGWAITSLTTVCDDIRRGITPTYTQEDGVCIINQKCIRGFRIEYSYAKMHDNKKRNQEHRFLQPGDILVNSTGVGTLGRVAQFWGAIESILADSHITIVRPKIQKISPHYLGIAVSGQQREIELLGEGSTGQTELNRHRLGGLTILQPSENVQHLFDNVSSPIIQRIQKNDLHALALSQLRDSLLPKLVSGELRIKNAEKFVEEALDA